MANGEIVSIPSAYSVITVGSTVQIEEWYQDGTFIGVFPRVKRMIQEELGRAQLWLPFGPDGVVVSDRGEFIADEGMGGARVTPEERAIAARYLHWNTDEGS